MSKRIVRKTSSPSPHEGEPRKPRPPKPFEKRRGFNAFAKHVRDNPGYARNIARCESCISFSSQGECTNKGVTEFDMVREESGKTYCSYWKGVPYDNGRKQKPEDGWGW